MIINPIWSNTTYSEELESPFYEYHIDEGEEVLYAGKAYKRPDDESASFLVNDVAENFLTNHIKMDGGQMEDYVKAFTLKTSTGSEEEYVFYNDWSYKSGKTLLNEPINGRIDGRQHLFINYLNLNKPEMEVQMSINGGN